MEKEISLKINEWSLKAIDDKDLIEEFNKIKNDEEKLFDAFYKELSFGTGGLRGVLGFGTNRMNIYVIRKATQGLANYLKKEYSSLNEIKVAIGFDSRIKSDLFAKEAARVLAANNINVYIYKNLLPVPTVSFATRELKCQAGIMVTASHNPSKYNGYKVYGSDGCQITSIAADKIIGEINEINPFEVKLSNFENNEFISYIADDILTKFIDRVKKESVLGNQNVDKNVKIVYSPLNGTGLIPVTRILKESGFNNITVVEEQRYPDGNFPTCPFPNPEIKEAMALGMEYAKKVDADLLLATDPDCDRVGIAVKDGDEYKLLTGNQTGVLLLNYICELRLLNNNMPKEPVAVKTIVTTDMADKIAEHYNVKLYSVLTGFKYIGDVIKMLEDKGMQNSYIFGFEESYGYLSGSYVRDKDGVNGAFLICEMFAYYKTRGISLIQKLNELYEKFGYYLNKLDNFVFEGASGFEKMNNIMASFRNKMPDIGGYKVNKVIDYVLGVDGLPKSDVVKFFLEDGSTITVRPSGTEPKLKLYCSIKAINEEMATDEYSKILSFLIKKFA